MSEMTLSEAFKAPLPSTRTTREACQQYAMCALTVLLLAVCVLSLAVGPTEVSLEHIWGAVEYWVLGEEAALTLRDKVVLMDIRLPRTLLGCLVGASLATCGAMMQGLFRNPLADPGLVGVSSGAALAAVCVITLSSALPAWILDGYSVYLLPWGAFIGGAATTALLYKVATRSGQTSIATMLLAGIALGALAGAVTGFLVFGSTDEELRDLTFWGMGGLGSSTWPRVWSTLPFTLAVLVALPFIAKGLNALLLGEAEAFHLGFNTQHLKRLIIILVAGGTGASVAAAGAIGFVGIVVPHVLRLIIGPDHRFLLPSCALLGASLLVAADVVARTVVAPAELPIGIITAVIGAPVFLSILLARNNQVQV
ncbi:heme ABC transporter permease [Pseudovibrio japonicus]|uniref:Heme ABC transporter permease n=1 Tax=Pseudovibrio japonicus TaxID=366534 RepID=A0ABQ3E879_9HYPH|nr:iron ABC transporter permease [Pseudovibrio japonicus]GHB26399.1 heme ABC transporter permease [Pseudovibrio japonicus]